MIPAASFLDTLKLAAETAAQAESDFRREIAERTKALERERAFAHRRLNLMRAISEVIASAEDEAVAVAAASAMLRAKLGWSSDSEARAAVLSSFAPVAQTLFASLDPPDDKDRPPPDVIKALGEFETWYAATYTGPFWALFENYIPETPLVDF